MPSVTTIADVCPDNLQDRELHSSIGIRFRDSLQAKKVTLSALSIIVTSEGLETTEKHSKVSQNGWILSILTRYWHVVASESGRINQSHVSLLFLSQFLEALYMYLSRIGALQTSSAIVHRTILLCAQVLTAVLIDRQFHLQSAIERSICMVLLHLVPLTQDSQHAPRKFIEQISSEFCESKGNRSRSCEIGEDLQVRSTFCSLILVI